MKAKSVLECWHIARSAAEAYQRRMNRARTEKQRLKCQAARDAADRVALKIRYGRVNIRRR